MDQTVDDYMDAARARAGLRSDRQLAISLGIEPTSACAWRTKRAWPADHQMVRLAELAGADPDVALVDLNIWRTKSEIAREQYSSIRRQITGARLVALFIAGLLAGLLGAPTGTQAAQTDVIASISTYYGKLKRSLRRLLNTVFPQFRRGLSAIS